MGQPLLELSKIRLRKSGVENRATVRLAKKRDGEIMQKLPKEVASRKPKSRRKCRTRLRDLINVFVS